MALLANLRYMKQMHPESSALKDFGAYLNQNKNHSQLQPSRRAWRAARQAGEAQDGSRARYPLTLILTLSLIAVSFLCRYCSS